MKTAVVWRMGLRPKLHCRTKSTSWPLPAQSKKPASMRASYGVRPRIVRPIHAGSPSAALCSGASATCCPNSKVSKQPPKNQGLTKLVSCVVGASNHGTFVGTRQWRPPLRRSWVRFFGCMLSLARPIILLVHVLWTGPSDRQRPSNIDVCPRYVDNPYKWTKKVTNAKILSSLPP